MRLITCTAIKLKDTKDHIFQIRNYLKQIKVTEWKFEYLTTNRSTDLVLKVCFDLILYVLANQMLIWTELRTHKTDKLIVETTVSFGAVKPPKLTMLTRQTTPETNLEYKRGKI